MRCVYQLITVHALVLFCRDQVVCTFSQPGVEDTIQFFCYGKMNLKVHTALTNSCHKRLVS